MNDLIKVEDRDIGDGQVQTINARELYIFLESKRKFADWIKERIELYEFKEGVDFVYHKIVTQYNQVDRIDFHISLDMAKEISMVERNEKGKQARQYFIQCEKRAKAPVLSLPDFTDPAIAARAWAEQFEAKQLAQKQLEAAKPAVEFVERYVEARTSQCISDVAKIIGWNPHAFFEQLKEDGVIFRRGVWLPYQEHIDNGRFEVKTGENDGFGFRQTRATPKGITWMAEKYGRDNMLEVSGAVLKKSKSAGVSKLN